MTAVAKPVTNSLHHPGFRVWEKLRPDTLTEIGRSKLAPITACPTPWPAWNDVCRGAGGGTGLAYGWHVIIGAGSGSGKSLLATNLAAHAVKHGEGVLMLSLEMSRSEVVTRLLSIASNIPARELEHGSRFSVTSWDQAQAHFFSLPGSFSINPEPVTSLDTIKNAIEFFADMGGRVVITDYLQLAWVRGAETLHEQITEVSHTIRGLAQKYRLVSVGLSQFNRAQSFGQAGALRKEGLMGGSSLENDADQVLLLSSPENVNEQHARHQVTLDKNRHGPRVEWTIIFERSTLRMREAFPEERPTTAPPSQRWQPK